MRSIVLWLGGLHTLISFLGGIGHCIVQTGLQKVISTIYADNAVGHMLTGKAISRAIRAHVIVDAALDAQLFTKLFGMIQNSHVADEGEPEVDNENHEETIDGSTDYLTEITHDELTVCDDPDYTEAKLVYDGLMAGSLAISDIESSQELLRISSRLDDVKLKSSHARTSKLWLQYMEMVEILQLCIMAERTGNWKQHLNVCAISQMLPSFAASGHN